MKKPYIPPSILVRHFTHPLLSGSDATLGITNVNVDDCATSKQGAGCGFQWNSGNQNGDLPSDDNWDVNY